MQHWTCRLVLLLAAAAVFVATPLRPGRAYYDRHNGVSHRSAHGGGTAVTSSTFVNLPGSNVEFSTFYPCVRVEFSAQIRAKHPKGLKVRAVLNGTTAGIPAAVEFYTPENRLDGRVVSFTFRNVPPGTGSMRIQVLSMDGSEVVIGNWTMHVFHEGAYG
jgi:hypothetical protein